MSGGGYTVWLPQLPDNDNPNIINSLPFVLENGKFNKETVIVGHSAGCPLALAVIQNIDVKIKQVILVAGYYKKLPPPGVSKVLFKKYNWEKIRQNADEFVFINSDNDPWGCDDKQGKFMFEKLGGTLIIKHGEGHMGSDSFKQPYKKFPLLVNLITKQLWGK